jgi:hypothetical protein
MIWEKQWARLRQMNEVLNVPAGIALYSAAGRYGRTKKLSLPARAGVGVAKQNEQ